MRTVESAQDMKDLWIGILRDGPLGLSDYLSELEAGARRVPTLRSLNRETRSSANILRQHSLRASVRQPAFVVKLDGDSEHRFVLNPDHPEVVQKCGDKLCADWRQLIAASKSSDVEEVEDVPVAPMQDRVPNAPVELEGSETEIDPHLLLYRDLRDVIAYVGAGEALVIDRELFTLEFVRVLCTLPDYMKIDPRDAVKYFVKLKGARLHCSHEDGDVYFLRPDRIKKRFSELPEQPNRQRGEELLLEVQIADFSALHASALAEIIVKRVAGDRQPGEKVLSVGDVGIVEDSADPTPVSAPSAPAVSVASVPQGAVSSSRISDSELEAEIAEARRRLDALTQVNVLRRQLRDAQKQVRKDDAEFLRLKAEHEAFATRVQSILQEFEALSSKLGKQQETCRGDRQIVEDVTGLLEKAEAALKR